MKKILTKISIFILFSVFIFAEETNAQKLIPLNSWLYDALYTLSSEQRIVINADIAPCSTKEYKLYLNKIDYESLSIESKKLYDEVIESLNYKTPGLDFKGIEAGINVNLYPELLYKSNDKIDWTFGGKKSVDYDINHYDSDGNLLNTETKTFDYTDVSNYSGNKLTKPLLSFPIFVNFSDYVYMETTPFITNSAVYMTKDSNFSNIPLEFNAMEFMQPISAYFSTGHIFDNKIGIDFQIGKEGLQIGRTLTGSVLYNDTFQTDSYFKFDLFSPNFKYDMNVVEVDHTKFLYLHNLEANPLNWLKVGFTEGVLINDSFELRFLNPVMIMHSYHSWTEYRNDEEYDIYRECHESAYFGVNFDVIPVNNLRLYGEYAQIEIQIPPELKNEYGKHLPTSFAAQLGAEYTIPLFGGWMFAKAEVLYNTPYMYYKTGADWSLYRKRFDNYNTRNNPLCSWIGSPFGPDTAAVQLELGYNNNNKWNVDFNYLFKANGENSFNLFFKTVDLDGKSYWIYYPSTKIHGDYVADSSLARSFALLGNIEYLNRLTLAGQYNLNKNLSFDGQFVYSFVFNNNHVAGDFEHGVQLSLAMEYKLF